MLNMISPFFCIIVLFLFELGDFRYFLSSLQISNANNAYINMPDDLFGLYGFILYDLNDCV